MLALVLSAGRTGGMKGWMVVEDEHGGRLGVSARLLPP